MPGSKDLKRIIRRHPLVGDVLELVGDEAQPGEVTSVDDLQIRVDIHGHELTRSQIVEAFKALDQAGFGQFIVGRRSYPSRFEWAESLVDSEDSMDDDDEEPVVPASSGQPGKVLDHRFRLRPNFDVVLALPVDFSRTEANRLAEFVKTLPFE